MAHLPRSAVGVLLGEWTQASQAGPLYRVRLLRYLAMDWSPDAVLTPPASMPTPALTPSAAAPSVVPTGAPSTSSPVPPAPPPGAVAPPALAASAADAAQVAGPAAIANSTSSPSTTLPAAAVAAALAEGSAPTSAAAVPPPSPPVISEQARLQHFSDVLCFALAQLGSAHTAVRLAALHVVRGVLRAWAAAGPPPLTAEGAVPVNEAFSALDASVSRHAFP